MADRVPDVAARKELLQFHREIRRVVHRHEKQQRHALDPFVLADFAGTRVECADLRLRACVQFADFLENLRHRRLDGECVRQRLDVDFPGKRLGLGQVEALEAVDAQQMLLYAVDGIAGKPEGVGAAQEFRVRMRRLLRQLLELRRDFFGRAGLDLSHEDVGLERIALRGCQVLEGSEFPVRRIPLHPDFLGERLVHEVFELCFGIDRRRRLGGRLADRAHRAVEDRLGLVRRLRPREGAERLRHDFFQTPPYARAVGGLPAHFAQQSFDGRLDQVQRALPEAVRAVDLAEVVGRHGLSFLRHLLHILAQSGVFHQAGDGLVRLRHRPLAENRRRLRPDGIGHLFDLERNRFPDRGGQAERNRGVALFEIRAAGQEEIRLVEHPDGLALALGAREQDLLPVFGRVFQDAIPLGLGVALRLRDDRVALREDRFQHLAAVLAGDLRRIALDDFLEIRDFLRLRHGAADGVARRAAVLLKVVQRCLVGPVELRRRLERLLPALGARGVDGTRVAVDDVADLLARQRLERTPGQRLRRRLVGRQPQFLADFVDFGHVHAVRGKRLHEGVLDRQDFLMGNRLRVRAQAVDVVVDLGELGFALERHFAGVIVARRHLLELVERDVEVREIDCHNFV